LAQMGNLTTPMGKGKEEGGCRGKSAGKKGGGHRVDGVREGRGGGLGWQKLLSRWGSATYWKTQKGGGKKGPWHVKRVKSQRQWGMGLLGKIGNVYLT